VWKNIQAAVFSIAEFHASSEAPPAGESFNDNDD
jgi:hypothetical protein